MGDQLVEQTYDRPSTLDRVSEESSQRSSRDQLARRRTSRLPSEGNLPESNSFTAPADKSFANRREAGLSSQRRERQAREPERIVAGVRDTIVQFFVGITHWFANFWRLVTENLQGQTDNILELLWYLLRVLILAAAIGGFVAAFIKYGPVTKTALGGSVSDIPLPANNSPGHIVSPNTGSYSGSLTQVWESIRQLDSKVDNTNLEIGRVKNLVKAQVTAYQQLTPQAVNFFSPIIGAQVDPLLTSPTLTTGSGFRALAHRALFPSRGQLPAITALMPWNEAGECWCAAASKGGLAQLGVRAPHIIRAYAVTIEHAPQRATLDIKSAPKNLEVWAQAENVVYGYSWAENAGCVTEKPQGEAWICLGVVKYDINGPTHIQTTGLVNHGVPARRFIVRVTANHGRDHSCLYRVQMHGEAVKKPFDN